MKIDKCFMGVTTVSCVHSSLVEPQLNQTLTRISIKPKETSTNKTYMEIPIKSKKLYKKLCFDHFSLSKRAIIFSLHNKGFFIFYHELNCCFLFHLISLGNKKRTSHTIFKFVCQLFLFFFLETLSSINGMRFCHIIP
jgi:hypothetical protein